MAHETLARRAKEIIDRLAATPRAAGSEGEARARKFCADFLTRLGFSVTEEEFSYSALPGKWAVPVFGLLSLTWFVVLGAALDRPRPERTIVAMLPFLPLLPLLYGFANRMMRRSRFLRRRGKNLVAIRGGTPRIWVMAHLDSKSQPVPMLVRISGIILAAAAMAVTLVLGFAPRLFGEALAIWTVADVAGVVGSLAVLFSTVGNRSPGAVDNATGVSAALLAAEESVDKIPLGVLLTSGEELGLAGAWAWVRDQADRYPYGHVRLAVNFDSLDDVGELTCMAERGNALSDRVRRIARIARTEMTFRGVLPGIMVDANALNASDWYAVTLSKGNLSTLARIHSPRDTPGRLSGRGVAEAVELVTEVIRREG